MQMIKKILWAISYIGLAYKRYIETVLEWLICICRYVMKNEYDTTELNNLF